MSFRSYMLEWFRAVHEIICVCFRYEFPLIWLLDEIFVPLFLCEMYGVLLAFEVEMRSL